MPHHSACGEVCPPLYCLSKSEAEWFCGRFFCPASFREGMLNCSAIAPQISKRRFPHLQKAAPASLKEAADRSQSKGNEVPHLQNREMNCGNSAKSASKFVSRFHNRQRNEAVPEEPAAASKKSESGDYISGTCASRSPVKGGRASSSVPSAGEKRWPVSRSSTGPPGQERARR